MLISPQNLAVQVNQIRNRIVQAAESVGRAPESVVLVAVSKAKPAESVAAAARVGVTDFGENYAQEAAEKMARVGNAALVWHFIGQLQSNKTRLVAQRFDWVHTVDRIRIAERLSQHRSPHAAPLNVCVQVKLIDEPSKGGVSPKDLKPLVEAIAGLPRLALRGLMCMPPPSQDLQLQQQNFAQLAQLRADLAAQGLELDTLSMGMSDDFEAAIREGATHVRIGTALFGAR